MATKYWGLRSRYAEAELRYRSRDPKEIISDILTALDTFTAGRPIEDDRTLLVATVT